MIPYSRPKLSDFYTLFESKLAENHTLHSGTHLYSSYMGVPPLPGVKLAIGIEQDVVCALSSVFRDNPTRPMSPVHHCEIPTNSNILAHNVCRSVANLARKFHLANEGKAMCLFQGDLTTEYLYF